MVVSVVQIGNSRGVRLPKAILEQLGINEKLELEIENQTIILKPVQEKVRNGWEDAFRKMALHKDDGLVLQDNDLEEGFEWEW